MLHFNISVQYTLAPNDYCFEHIFVLVDKHKNVFKVLTSTTLKCILYKNRTACDILLTRLKRFIVIIFTSDHIELAVQVIALVSAAFQAQHLILGKLTLREGPGVGSRFAAPSSDSIDNRTMAIQTGLGINSSLKADELIRPCILSSSAFTDLSFSQEKSSEPDQQRPSRRTLLERVYLPPMTSRHGITASPSISEVNMSSFSITVCLVDHRPARQS